jgi:hypothetical protein
MGVSRKNNKTKKTKRNCTRCTLPMRLLILGEDQKRYYSPVEPDFCPVCLKNWVKRYLQQQAKT